MSWQKRYQIYFLLPNLSVTDDANYDHILFVLNQVPFRIIVIQAVKMFHYSIRTKDTTFSFLNAKVITLIDYLPTDEIIRG